MNRPTTQKPTLIILSAPSGGGKTTLCDRLLQDFSDRLILSISSTTRSPRAGEVDGKDYFFLTHDQFRSKIDNNEFAEWAEVHANYYGTSKEFIRTTLTKGLSILLDIDVQGGASLVNSFPDSCYRIFIAPPSLEVLEQRLRIRGTDTEEIIQRRLKNANQEMARSSEYDVCIINDDLDQAFQELKQLIAKKIGAPIG